MVNSAGHDVVDSDDRVYSCIHCGNDVPELYHSYSPTVLKISECEKCNHVADEYIECDFTLVLLDLFLQKLPAYRHVMCNSALKNAWRLLLIFIFCDAYYNWVETNAANTDGKMVHIYDLEWHFYVNIIQTFIETSITIAILAPFCLLIWRTRRIVPRPIVGSSMPTTQDAFQAVMNKLQIGFYGNVLVLFAVIWEQHQSVPFIVLTRIFLFVSHIQVIRAMTNIGFVSAAPIVALAMIAGRCARLFATKITNHD